jgi:hypothetical protein
MGGFRGSRSQELAKLQLQLADVGRLLDEIERRSARRRAGRALEVTSANCVSSLTPENPETRFAACVASGMSKIRAPVEPRK